MAENSAKFITGRKASHIKIFNFNLSYSQVSSFSELKRRNLIAFNVNPAEVAESTGQKFYGNGYERTVNKIKIYNII